MLRRVLFFTALLCLVVGAQVAYAIPDLQLYIEGATYDTASQTWVTNSSSFRLWVIGNTGAIGTITDVHLAVAFMTSENSGGANVSLTPTTAGGTGSYNGYTDPSTPPAPTLDYTSADGQIPTLDDGSSLPAHGIYGTGVSFYRYTLGDMTLFDSPIGDFTNSGGTGIPTPSSTNQAQINAYDVVVTGFASGVHFDAFNHIAAANGGSRYIFAPFSHDAGSGGTGGTGGSAPEPGTLMLLGTGLVGLMASRKK